MCIIECSSDNKDNTVLMILVILTNIWKVEFHLVETFSFNFICGSYICFSIFQSWIKACRLDLKWRIHLPLLVYQLLDWSFLSTLNNSVYCMSKTSKVSPFSVVSHNICLKQFYFTHIPFSKYVFLKTA